MNPQIVVGDITELAVDAIVNAANEALAPGGGVCGAIHAAAGAAALAAACRELGGCPTGDARITPGFDLPARHVIHAVGPVYSGTAADARLLASAYRRSLELARAHGLSSLAFPCISTGIFGYPPEAAAAVALETIRAWLAGGKPPRQVICCCFLEADAAVYRRLIWAKSSPSQPEAGTAKEEKEERRKKKG